jgi:transcription elongation factor GreA-like protein
MLDIFHEGEQVRHKKKADWGVGKIIAVDSSGTVRVVFEGNKKVSIVKGSKYLTKII